MFCVSPAVRVSPPSSYLLLSVLVLSEILLLCVEPVGAVDSCSTVNTTFQQSSEVNASCTTVSLVNNVQAANTSLNISIGSILQANPWALNITVNVTNFTLLNGAALYVDCTGCRSFQSTAAVSLLIQRLSGQNGALVFIGSFPAGTTIAVSDVKMTSDDSIPVSPKLPLIDKLNPGVGKMLLLYSLALANGSSLVLRNLSLVVSTNVGCVPVYEIGGLNVTNRSQVTFLESAIAVRGPSSAFVFHTFVSVSQLSSLSIVNCNLSSTAPPPIYFALKFNTCPVTVASFSTLAISGNLLAALGIGSALFFYGSSTTLSANSSWLVTGNLFNTTSVSIPIIFDALSPIRAMPTSWILWSSNNISSAGNATCFSIQSFLFVDTGAAMSFMDNKCDATNWMWRNASGNDTTMGSSGGVLYVRCNQVQGAVGLFGLPTRAVSTGSCGTCNTSSDCYTSMTAPNSACSIGSAGTAICTCAQGAIGNLCLPNAPAVILPNRQCSFINTVLSTSVAIDSSCTSVLLANVSTRGSNISIYINISGTVQASSKPTSLMVSMSNVTLANGAAIIIESSWASSPSSSAASINVSVLIQFIVGADSALAFIGSFPPYTSILLSDVNMTTTSTSAPKLLAWSPVNFYPKIVLLANFCLTNSSAFVFRRSSLTALIPSTSPVLFQNATTALTNASSLVFMNVTITTAGAESFAIYVLTHVLSCLTSWLCQIIAESASRE